MTAASATPRPSRVPIGVVPTIERAASGRVTVSITEPGDETPEIDHSTAFQILDGLPIGVFVMDQSGSPRYANALALDLLGKGLDPAADTDDLSSVYRPFVAGTDDLYPGSDLPVVRALAGERSHVTDMEVRSANGPIVLEVWGQPLAGEDGATKYGLALFADITQEALAEAVVAEQAVELARSNVELAEAQSIARVGSWELDLATSGIRWSDELRRLFGFALDAHPTYEALVDRTYPEDREFVLQAHRVAVADFGPFLVEHRVLLADGAVRWMRARGRVELDPSGRARRLLGTAQDVTEQKDAESAVQHHALHEPLTGLPNRLLMLDRLGHALNRLAREGSTVAVIHLDLDRFSLINETLGHEIGDQVLLEVTARLNNRVRPGDTLAHVGGDEFVVLCEAISGELEAVSVADRLRAAVSEPLDWGDGVLVVSVSAGVALTRLASSSPDSLLRDAAAAMIRAKSQGRARTAVFAPTMRTGAAARLDTEMELRQAIANDDLCVFYQPIVSLADGAILGHEALVRWVHPTRGLLGPDQFISIAEDTGLIVPLGLWVLREACQQARRFQTRDPSWSDLTMSVNLSGGQLGQPALVALVAQALDDAGLRPEHLQLEMTESVLMNDAAGTIRVLERLKELGICLGVDDFGTGYSSLAYLRRFPVDVLKIDQSFVQGLGDDAEEAAIVATIVSLAGTLDLTTIAEGVETEAQRDCLLELGCSRAQGYLFARPAAASDVEAALDRAVPAKS